MYDWRELVVMPEAELARLDIARVHAACATGLSCAKDLPDDACSTFADSCAATVGETTERLLPRFREHPERFNGSEGVFRMACLVTVMQRDIGVRLTDELNKSDDFSNSDFLFIHGIVRGKPGTCSNVPVLFAALGRRLGYPVKLVATAHHQFIRWDDASGERFNIDCTVQGMDMPPDEYQG